MTEVNEDPNSVPKDGSVINVQFRDGMTNKARWNTGTGQWEALDSIGHWRADELPSRQRHLVAELMPMSGR